MNKKKTIFKLLLSIFTCLLIIVFFIFFLKIIKNKNQNTSMSLINLEEKINQKERSIMFSEKSSEIKDLQNSINNYFVETKKIDKFVNYLEDIGSGVGSEIIVKEILASEKTEGIIEFQVLIKGNFDQVTKTVLFLENIPYQIEIMRVYYNKDLKREIENDKKDLVAPTIWQADVSFNILSLD